MVIKINIVVVYDQAYISGGAAKIAIFSAIELKKQGHRVIYFSAVGDICNELKDNGIEVYCLNEKHIAKTKNPLALLKGIWNNHSKKCIMEILSLLNPDETVVHIHGWTKALSSSIFWATYKLKIKTIVTLHEYFTICPNGGLFNYNKNSICLKTPNSISCHLCNCDKRNYMQKLYRVTRQIIQNLVLKISRPYIIFITEFSKEHIRNYLPFQPRKIFDVSNYVQISSIERVPVENNSKYLFIGRLSSEKGIDLFCQAIRMAGVKGLVIGDGPLRKKYEKDYPEIEFLGWLPSEEISYHLLQARCLIIASIWYETMGLTAVEMQPYGIPCVIPKQCAASEYIVNERTGFLYEIGNLESLVECIEKMKDNDKVKFLSQNMYMNVDFIKYSIDTHTHTLLRVYKTILNEEK